VQLKSLPETIKGRIKSEVMVTMDDREQDHTYGQKIAAEITYLNFTRACA
jgi:hypothetical protein